MILKIIILNLIQKNVSKQSKYLNKNEGYELNPIKIENKFE